ncbi:hypothetical protein KFK09_016484 [Dendrobium nobile]|uniref:Uncharacterized protein n=1 Tax=Dendrobium nobile TaxID=94219 RepID=A0A8T3AYU2_DENNO|nr:hypothetical protein KFK09_016484 [Dendrobium nobile]
MVLAFSFSYKLLGMIFTRITLQEFLDLLFSIHVKFVIIVKSCENNYELGYSYPARILKEEGIPKGRVFFHLEDRAGWL